MTLRDHGVVVPGEEIPFPPEARPENELGQFVVDEEVVEPRDLPAAHAPRDPDVPGRLPTGPPGLDDPLEPGLLRRPRGHEGPPARAEDAGGLAPRRQPPPLRREG